ncbi:MAG: thioesterase family protein [Acetobacteraceae bacterium]
MTPKPGTGPVIPAPFRSGPFTVRPEWIDDNGHLNLAYYLVLFDWATDAIWAAIGLGDAFRATGRGTFAAESHILYKAELVAGDTVTVRSQILGLDGKRLHLSHEMNKVQDHSVAAQQEIMFLSVDLGSRRVAPFPAEVAGRIAAAACAHAGLERPDWVGRRIAMPAASPV